MHRILRYEQYGLKLLGKVLLEKIIRSLPFVKIIYIGINGRVRNLEDISNFREELIMNTADSKKRFRNLCYLIG